MDLQTLDVMGYSVSVQHQTHGHTSPTWVLVGVMNPDVRSIIKPDEHATGEWNKVLDAAFKLVSADWLSPRIPPVDLPWSKDGRYAITSEKRGTSYRIEKTGYGKGEGKAMLYRLTINDRYAGSWEKQTEAKAAAAKDGWTR